MCENYEAIILYLHRTHTCSWCAKLHLDTVLSVYALGRSRLQLVLIKDDSTKAQNHSGPSQEHTCVLRMLYKAHLRDVCSFGGLGLGEAGKRIRALQ